MKTFSKFLTEKTSNIKVGYLVRTKNIKTKRMKTYKVTKVRKDGKIETNTGKIIYPSDIEKVIPQ